MSDGYHIVHIMCNIIFQQHTTVTHTFIQLLLRTKILQLASQQLHSPISQYLSALLILKDVKKKSNFVPCIRIGKKNKH